MLRCEKENLESDHPNERHYYSTITVRLKAHYKNIWEDYKVYYRKIHSLTSEFHVKFHAKNRYRTNREAMSAISVFQVKFNVEFARQAVNFS